MNEPSDLSIHPGQEMPAVPLVASTATALARHNTKLLLVDFRSGEAVSQHPEIQSYLQQGWQVKSAVPRLVEAGGTRLLVVLTQSGNTAGRLSGPSPEVTYSGSHL